MLFSDHASRVTRHALRLRGARAPAAALCLLAGLAAARAGAAVRPRLCIEYLPAIVYDDDAVTLCARVESPGEDTAVRFLFSASLLAGSGRVLASDMAKGSAKSEAPWRRHSSLRPSGAEPAKLLVRVMPAGGGLPLAAVEVPVLRARAPLPPLQAKGLRLADAKGRRVLVRIEHRTWKPKETWPLVRWLSYKFYGDSWDVARAALLGDDLGAPRNGYLAQVAARSPVPLQTIPVASAGPDVGLPVLRAVAALTRAKLQPNTGLALVCLGHRDADFGSDVLQFRKAVELIVQQLERRGCAHCVLVAPTGPSHLKKRLAPYHKATRYVAHNYRAHLLDLAPRLTDDHYAGGPPGGRLLLRLPGPAGHRAIADALAAFLKSVVR